MKLFDRSNLSGKYFVSIAFSQDEQNFEKTNKAVGIDLGFVTAPKNLCKTVQN